METAEPMEAAACNIIQRVAAGQLNQVRPVYMNDQLNEFTSRLSELVGLVGPSREHHVEVSDLLPIYIVCGTLLSNCIRGVHRF